MEKEQPRNEELNPFNLIYLFMFGLFIFGFALVAIVPMDNVLISQNQANFKQMCQNHNGTYVSAKGALPIFDKEYICKEKLELKDGGFIYSEVSYKW